MRKCLRQSAARAEERPPAERRTVMTSQECKQVHLPKYFDVLPLYATLYLYSGVDKVPERHTWVKVQICYQKSTLVKVKVAHTHNEAASRVFSPTVGALPDVSPLYCNCVQPSINSSANVHQFIHPPPLPLGTVIHPQWPLTPHPLHSVQVNTGSMQQ